jgi:hypothetical protein
LDPISKFGQVRNAPRPVASNVVSVGNFEGWGHVVRELRTISQTGDRQKEWWIVNSHIDIATCNDVYNL